MSQELIDGVKKEKIVLEKTIEEKKTEIDGLKRETEDLFLRAENEMDQKDDELTRFISVLQNDCDGQGKTNEKLSYEVGKLSNALEQMALEREKNDKALVVEKRHGEELKTTWRGT